MSEVQFYQTVQAQELEDKQIKAINIANLIRNLSSTELEFLASSLIYLNENTAEILSNKIRAMQLEKDFS